MDGRVKVKNKTNIKNKNLPFSIYKKMWPIHFMSNFQKNSKDYGEPDITYQLAGSDKLGFEGNTLPDVFYIENK